MRIKYRYTRWDEEPHQIKKIINILDGFSIKYICKEDLDCVIPSFRHNIEFYLYEDLPFFDEIKHRIKTFDLLEQVSTEYDKKEIENAEWFIISTGEYQYPQPDDDFEYLKHTFDLDNHCCLCGIGKVQNAPYRLKHEPKQKNNQFWGLYWEFEPVFVREETKNILEKEKIKEIHFTQPVIHKNNKPVEKLYQLHIDTVLDKGFNGNNTDKEVCDKDNKERNLKCCGRIKYCHPKKGGYVFDKNIFSKEIDFYISNEYFGSGGSASRINIISKKIKGIIEKNKLKGLRLEPILYE